MISALPASTRRAFWCASLVLLAGCSVEDRALNYGASAISSGSSSGLTAAGGDAGQGSSGGEAGDAPGAGGTAGENTDGGARAAAGTAGGGRAPTETGGAASTGGVAPTAGNSASGGVSGGGLSGSGGMSGSGGAGGSGGASGSGGSAGKPDEGPCGDIDQDGVQDCQETIAKNPGFDADVKSWDVDFNLTQAWKNEDARGTTGSGSMSVVFTTAVGDSSWAAGAASQCLPAWGEKQFELGARAFIPAGQGAGTAQLSLALFGSDDCAGNFLGTTTPALSIQTGAWQVLHSSVKLPAGTRSVLVRLTATKPGTQATLEVHFDDVLFREK